MQCLRGRVVDAGDIIPGVGLQRRRPVAEHVPAGAVGQLEADPARAGVDGGVELEAGLAAGAFGDDGRVVAGERAGVDPGTDRHAAGEPQRRRIAEIDVVVDAVEPDAVAVFAGGEYRAAGQRAGEAVAGGIHRGGAACLVEGVGGREQRICRQQQPGFEAFEHQRCARSRGPGGIAVINGVVEPARGPSADERPAEHFPRHRHFSPPINKTDSQHARFGAQWKSEWHGKFR